MFSLVFSLALSTASAFCSNHHTCCCMWDFFIPVSCECVENEPAAGFFSHEKDNCARDDQRSAVPMWARLEEKDWALHGVCNGKTPVVSRAEIEAREAKEREFRKNYDTFCGQQNAANCTANETCYFDGRHIDGSAEVRRGDVTDKGAACVCEFPLGRHNVDGTGTCVACKAGPDGKPAYVQKSGEPGAKGFHNGEFACALGADTSARTDLVV